MPIKRLRGLDEFVAPAFVGRMARVERWRKHAGWSPRDYALHIRMN